MSGGFDIKFCVVCEIVGLETSLLLSKCIDGIITLVASRSIKL